ncbi:hypothetical protein Q5752_001197 [Cryptotrichosporon argae]
MPRKSAASAITAPSGGAPVAPAPPSPLVAALRRDWRWAAISQFTFTFADAFGRVDWDVEALEADFDGTETAVIPELLAKLLVALTWNRQINRDNAFEHVRKQYEKRAAERNVLGTVDEPVEWATLGLGQKVGIIHDLCEWQLADPARFRSLLKSEDDAVSWRVDPVGWDKDGNAYYLFDDNRLWIQRVPPAPPTPAPAARPPKKTSLKAKRAARAARRAAPKAKPARSASPTPTPDAPARTPSKSHRKRGPEYSPPPPKQETPVSGPRRRKPVELYGNPTPTAAALRRGSGAPAPPTDRSTRSGRADGGAAGTSASAAQPSPTRPPMPRGTRVSRRLHHVDDEWQAVPDEWLGGAAGANGTGGNGAAAKKERAADEESELSELTDEDEHEAKLNGVSAERRVDVGDADDAKVKDETAEDEVKPEADGVGEEEEEKEEPAADVGAIETDPESPLSSAPSLLPEDIPDDPEHGPDAEYDPSVAAADDDAEPGRRKDRKRKRADSDEIEIDESRPVVDDFEEMRKERDAFPEGFIEWEAICVTLYDWKTVPQRFAKSRDPDEKALYGGLQQVSSTIIDELEAKERERLKQEAINNRKRSSRIATRELEREEQLKREAAQRDMEERMERGRREAERAARDEAELLARERAREARLREREERLAAREQAVVDRAEAELRARDEAEAERAERKRRRDNGLQYADGTSRSASVADGDGDGDGEPAAGAERWELKCDVCGRHEWKTTDEDDVVACDGCGRWAHMSCHDKRDREHGRAPRDWDKVDFYCVECRRKRSHANGHAQSSLGAPHAPSTSSPLAANGRRHVQPPAPVPGPSLSPSAHRHHLPPPPHATIATHAPHAQLIAHHPGLSAHPQAYAHPHAPPQAYPAFPNGALYPPPGAAPLPPMRAHPAGACPPSVQQPGPHLPHPHMSPPYGQAPPGAYATLPPDPRHSDPRYAPQAQPPTGYPAYPPGYRPPQSPQSGTGRLPLPGPEMHHSAPYGPPGAAQPYPPAHPHAHASAQCPPHPHPHPQYPPQPRAQASPPQSRPVLPPVMGQSPPHPAQLLQPQPPVPHAVRQPPE